jgi:hypothetical protein
MESPLNKVSSFSALSSMSISPIILRVAGWRLSALSSCSCVIARISIRISPILFLFRNSAAII